MRLMIFGENILSGQKQEYEHDPYSLHHVISESQKSHKIAEQASHSDCSICRQYLIATFCHPHKVVFDLEFCLAAASIMATIINKLSA